MSDLLLSVAALVGAAAPAPEAASNAADMAETLRPYLWLIPGLPFLASVVTGFLGPRLLRGQSHWPVVLGLVGSFLCAASLFAVVYKSDTAAVVYDYPWIVVGDVKVYATLRADALSAVMAVMVTFIGTFIAIYSVGYMHGDPGYPRFFAAVGLFIAAMTTLVLADNLILLYAGWEGVGLCSYLLIGFWFTKPSAADAARKAFLVTRLGDIGLFLGILLLWLTYGSLSFDAVLGAVREQMRTGLTSTQSNVLFAAALLLFCGAAGKSAQFPLHVWLPDAMEGPTPVSALIHAATMVTAGVYLVARATPIYMAAPDAQVIVAAIGGFTALLAALIALTQTDLKRVLAYSTLSQLGYMFLGLGCAVRAGGQGLVLFAVTAAMFHLFTHAFFKALLFLGAGSVMHSMGHVIDMRRFSGLRQVMPVTHWTFLAGSLALAGFPGLAGFWSKDEILDACHRASIANGMHDAIYFVLLMSALFTAGLTAFYTFRAYFKTFWGELVIPDEAYHHHGHGSDQDAHGHDHGGHAPAHHAAHAHAGGHGEVQCFESPAVMTVPLMVLAVFAVGVGFVLGPFMPESLQFGHFMEKMGHTSYWTHGDGEHHVNWTLMGLSSAIAVGGIVLAWLMYVKRPELPGKVAEAAPLPYQLSLNKFFIDEIYGMLIVRPAQAVADLSRRFDGGLIDSFVDLVGHLPRMLGEVFRPIQNGLVQFYALAMILGLTVFLLSLLYKL